MRPLVALNKIILGAVLAFGLATASLADTYLGVGYNVMHDLEKSYTLMLRESFVDNRFALGFGWVGPIRRRACPRPDCFDELKSQMFVSAEAMYSFKKLTFGIGPSYWSRKTVLMSSNLNAKLSVWYDLGEHAQLGIVHFSNGGSGEEITRLQNTRQFNLGLNMVTFDIRF